MSRKPYVKKSEDPTTIAKAGTAWHPQEDSALMKRLAEDMELDDIAKAHRRTLGAIVYRLKLLAWREIDAEEITMKRASKKYGVSEEDLLEFKEKKEAQKQKAKEKREAAKVKPKTKSSTKSDSKGESEADADLLLNLLTRMTSLEKKFTSLRDELVETKLKVMELTKRLKKSDDSSSSEVCGSESEPESESDSE